MSEPDQTGDQAAAENAASSSPSVAKIKKYANRRLYNTATSSYVTLDDLAQMVKQKIEFVVHDAKTGDDITRTVLTQIIVEEEAKGQNLLPISFLRQLIGFYGDNLQAVVPRYLEASMQMFSRNQEQFRDYMKGSFGNLFPFGQQFEEMSKQNMAVFQNAMQQMWAPFAGAAAPKAPPEAPTAPASEAGIDELKRQLEAMQRRLDDLARK